MKNNVAIILAAGKSTRLKLDLPKVLQPILGRPLLSYVIDAVRDAEIRKIFVVLGFKRDLIKKILSKDIECIIQERQRGTADAVRCAEKKLKEYSGDILVVYGDHPLLRSQTLKRLILYHKRGAFDCTLLTAKISNPSGYGRIIRNKNNRVIRIIEEINCSKEQLRICEVNGGVLCFKSDVLFDSLKDIKINERKKEFYLTDIVRILSQKGAKIGDIFSDFPEEDALGVNTQTDLIRANELMRKRRISELILKGVRIISPDTTFIDFDVSIGKNSVIYPFTVIEKDVKIGKNCSIGPFCRIREGTVIKDNVELGNFTEVVRSDIKERTKIKHFSYLGDARIGKSVNIGAGVVTANFDGKRKNVTYIKDKAFIGSDTILVAPVKVGKNAVTGAGCVVTKKKNVPDNTTVVGVPAKMLRRKNA
jgi:bifunctional UDP-N-acetylglucosamine pyrophosphorylase/glucosamine-1-phosphate N-acetyltransferase